MKKYTLFHILLIVFLLAGIYAFSSYSLKSNKTEKKAIEEKKPVSDKNTATENKSVVFMTKSITPAGIMEVYNALGRKVSGKVAVKISTGKTGGHNKS